MKTLVVMLKEPQAGRVKTRLGRDIGAIAAAWWYRHQTRALLRRLADPRWRIVLAVTPDRAGLCSRVWPAHLPRIGQGRGDLGRRMAHAIGAAAPRGDVLLIGSDIPGIRSAHIAQGFAILARNDAVFGPAEDGGFWMVGARHGGRTLPAGAFKGARWSTCYALRDTLDSFGGLRIGLAATLRDVDTIDDLPMTRRAVRDTQIS
jgi:rSAM/selenodomain-associated transferase 1